MKRIKLILNTIFLVSALAVFVSCNGQNQKSSESKFAQSINHVIGDTVSEIGKNIDCILQDRNDNVWFATNGDGVYRYHGKSLTHLTVNNGLRSNFVLRMQEDIHGDIWFTTRDGVCRFDGSSFIDFTDTIKNAIKGEVNFMNGGLFFDQRNGVCYFDGKSFTNFTIHPISYMPDPSNLNRPYSIYSTLIDKSGNVWFGTQEKGVCRYNGKSFAFFTEDGLDKAAVRCLFQDKAGTIWAGNNGAGLFRYDKNKFINVTDEKKLGNPNFLKNLTAREGTLARVWTINEDREGYLWIGTIDAGVWRYDGKRLINYTTNDGLAGNSIWTIFKDNKGELWFVTDGDAICKFDGKSFGRFSFN